MAGEHGQGSPVGGLSGRVGGLARIRCRPVAGGVLKVVLGDGRAAGGNCAERLRTCGNTSSVGGQEHVDHKTVRRLTRLGARDALTASELEKLRMAIVGDPWEAGWMLTLAGPRRSELLGLRWSDFDSDPGELAVNRGRVAKGGIGQPKTTRGRRVLLVDAERARLLVALREWQASTYGPDQVVNGFILINEFGRPMRPEDWTRRWRQLCRSTEGVRNDHTLHAARHSTVTFMRNAAVPDHIVAAWHGHDEVVMRRTYSHVHTQQMRVAGSALSFGAPKELARPASPGAVMACSDMPHRLERATGLLRQSGHIGTQGVPRASGRPSPRTS